MSNLDNLISEDKLNKIIEKNIRSVLNEKQTVNSFDSHFFIEFYYRVEKRFLTEHFEIKKQKLLFEKFGVFDGMDDIIRTVFSAYTKTNKTKAVVKINRFFINNITLNILSKDNTFNYLSNNNKPDENGRLDLTFSVVGGLPFNDFCVLFAHELQHAYEDYNLKQKDDSILNKAEKSGYNKNYLVDLKSSNAIIKWITFIIYNFNKFERNAYVVEISKELETLIKNNKTHSINDVLQIVRKTSAYRNFEILFKFCDMFSKVEDKKTQIFVLNVVNEKSNLSFNTFNQFVKWLQENKRKWQNKLNNIVPKIAYEKLCEGKLLIPSKLIRDFVDKETIDLETKITLF